MNTRIKNHTVKTHSLVRFAAIAIFGFAAGAHGQVLGGQGGLGGNLGGGLSSGPQNMGGSLSGGLGGSTEFGTNAVDRTRRLGDRAAGNTRSRIDEVRAVSDKKVETAKVTGRNTRRTAGATTQRVESAQHSGHVAGSLAGSAASQAEAKGANAAANGSALGAGDVNRHAGAINGATHVERAADGAMPTHAPNVMADGEASADASTSRAKSKPKARASAEADGNASVSRR